MSENGKEVTVETAIMDKDHPKNNINSFKEIMDSKNIENAENMISNSQNNFSNDEEQQINKTEELRSYSDGTATSDAIKDECVLKYNEISPIIFSYLPKRILTLDDFFNFLLVKIIAKSHYVLPFDLQFATNMLKTSNGRSSFIHILNIMRTQSCELSEYAFFMLGYLVECCLVGLNIDGATVNTRAADKVRDMNIEEKNDGEKVSIDQCILPLVTMSQTFYTTVLCGKENEKNKVFLYAIIKNHLSFRQFQFWKIAYDQHAKQQMKNSGIYERWKELEVLNELTTNMIQTSKETLSDAGVLKNSDKKEKNKDDESHLNPLLEKAIKAATEYEKQQKTEAEVQENLKMINSLHEKNRQNLLLMSLANNESTLSTIVMMSKLEQDTQSYLSEQTTPVKQNDLINSFSTISGSSIALQMKKNARIKAEILGIPIKHQSSMSPLSKSSKQSVASSSLHSSEIFSEESSVLSKSEPVVVVNDKQILKKKVSELSHNSSSINESTELTIKNSQNEINNTNSSNLINDSSLVSCGNINNTVVNNFESDELNSFRIKSNKRNTKLECSAIIPTNDSIVGSSMNLNNSNSNNSNSNATKNSSLLIPTGEDTRISCGNSELGNSKVMYINGMKVIDIPNDDQSYSLVPSIAPGLDNVYIKQIKQQKEMIDEKFAQLKFDLHQQHVSHLSFIVNSMTCFGVVQKDIKNFIRYVDECFEIHLKKSEYDMMCECILNSKTITLPPNDYKRILSEFQNLKVHLNNEQNLFAKELKNIKFSSSIISAKTKLGNWPPDFNDEYGQKLRNNIITRITTFYSLFASKNKKKSLYVIPNIINMIEVFDLDMNRFVKTITGDALLPTFNIRNMFLMDENKESGDDDTIRSCCNPECEFKYDILKESTCPKCHTHTSDFVIYKNILFAFYKYVFGNEASDIQTYGDNNELKYPYTKYFDLPGVVQNPFDTKIASVDPNLNRIKKQSMESLRNRLAMRAKLVSETNNY